MGHSRLTGAGARIAQRLGFLAAAMFFLLAACESASNPSTPPLTAEEQLVVQGRQVYQDYCITCHGQTGSGLEEARTRFPDTHKKCERCHFRSLPPVPPTAGDPFSIGDPPDLRGLSESGRFASRIAVYSFIRASMPRWAPGSLSDDEYLALSHYLWEEIGAVSDLPVPAVVGAPDSHLAGK